MYKTEQLVKLEHMLIMPFSLIILKPNLLFKDWLTELYARENSISINHDEITLENISQDSVVFCVPQFMQADECQMYLEKNYKKLLELTLSSWCPVTAWWPSVNNYVNFLQLFTPEFHSNIYNTFKIANLTNISPVSSQNTDALSTQTICRLNCMILLLRPLREFWAWIQKIEHQLPADLQARFKSVDGVKALDMNCSAYCIPEYTEEADIHQFIIDMTPSFLKEELVRWNVPLEHAETFHASGALETYFNLELHASVIFDFSELMDEERVSNLTSAE